MAFREISHLIFALSFIFTIYYDLQYVKIPHSKPNTAGRLKYLTFWNLVLQALFFTLSCINDVIGTRTEDPGKRGRLQTFLDIVFASLAFPVATFVFLSFWVLYLINRELVFPSVLDKYFPVWLNHLMHTLVLPAVVTEMFLVNHHYQCRRRSVTILCFFTGVYLAWTFFIAYVWGFWTYPILQVLNWWQRIFFLMACMAFITLFYFIGEALHKAIWGVKDSPRRNHAKKQKKSI